MQDKELIADFVIEANEHLGDIENQFLAIEEAAPSVDVDLVNEVFRAIHSIKGAAGFLGLTTVTDLERIASAARRLEDSFSILETGVIAEVPELTFYDAKGNLRRRVPLRLHFHW